MGRGELPHLEKRAETVPQDRLDSWKEIAVYLKRDVRTVQRWEKTEGLPIHRHLHSARGSIYAYKTAVDAWWHQRSPQLEADAGPAPPASQGRAGTTGMRLVVLPFENMSSEPEQDFFSDGLTEEMITRLGRLRPDRLSVIARTTAMQYRGTTRRIDQIARELGADFFLEGSVRRTANRVRITAQLIKASDQTHLWAETYERMLEDVLDIQSDVTQQIARSLELELLPDEKAGLARGATRNSAAHDAYLKGRFFWSQRIEEGFTRSLGCFQQAVEMDPAYAEAYAALAESYVTLGWYGAFPPREAFDRSRDAALRALAIREQTTEAHTALAYAKMFHEWNWEEIEREHQRALSIDPASVTGHHWYALFLAAMGRSAEAFEHMQRALELDPLSVVLHAHLGWVLYHGREFKSAIVQLQKTRDMDPNFPIGRYFLGLACAYSRRRKEAIAELEISTKMTGGQPGWLATLGHIYGLEGRKTEARKCLRELEEMMKRRYVPAYCLAFTCAGIGDKDAAFEWLEKAFEERSGWLVYLNVESAMNSLRSDRRFKDLVHRVGLPPAGRL